MLVLSELKELVNDIEACVPSNPPYFFPHKCMLKDAIKYYEDTELIIVDIGTGDMWQRGKKTKEKYGDNYE